MADDDFDLVGRVRIDTSDLGNVSSSITGSFGKMAGIAGAALAGIGLSEWVKGGIESLANMSRIQEQTAAVIKSTGGAAGITATQIGSFADALEKTTGIESESIREGENMLLTFTNVKNGVGKGNDVFTQASKTLVDMSTAMGGDAKASAIQLGKALNDPIKGITALSKVGVTFDDVQKKQIETMVKQGNVAGAQKVILAELNKEFGGSAEAFGKSGAGAMARFENSMGDLQEAVATGVLPIVTKLTDFVSKNMPAVIEKVSEVFDAISGGFENPDAGVAFGGMEAVLIRIGQVARNVYDAVKRVVSAISSIIKGDLAGAGVDIGVLLGFEEDSDFTGGVIKTLETMKTVIGNVIDFVSKNWPTIQKTFETVAGFIRDNILPILGGIAGALAAGGAVSLVGAIGAASAAIGAFITTAGGPLAAIIAALGGPITLAIVGIAALVAGVIYAYQHFEGFRNVVDGVITFITEQFTHLIAFGQEILPQLQEAFSHVFNVIQVIVTTVVDLIMAAWRLFGDDIIKVASGAFQIVKSVVETVINTIANIIRLVLAVINGDWGKAWQALKNIVSGIFEGIKGVVSGALEMIVGYVGGVYDGLKRAATVAFGAITDAISGVVGGMFNIGKNIIQGIIDGIKAMAGALIDAIKRNVTDALPDFAKKALDIHSPSGVFRDIAMQIPAGMVQGITQGAGAVTSAMNDMLDVGTLRYGTDSALAGAMAGGGVSIGDIYIYGANDPNDPGWASQLTDAIRAGVGGNR